MQGSRIPGLKEMNPSGTNSRSRLMQPGAIANKTTAVPRMSLESLRKDKTKLIGAEPSRTRSTTENTRTGAGTPSVSRSANGTTKTHGRANSYASSTLTRSASAASRRGPLSQSTIGRSNTSLSKSRRPNGHSIPRPATSLDTHEEESGHRVLGKRKGMHTSCFLMSPPTSPTPLFSTWRAPLDFRETSRASRSNLPPLLEHSWEAYQCETSLCASMDDLSLGPFSSEALDPNVLLEHDRNPIHSPSRIPIPSPAKSAFSSPQLQHNHSPRRKRPPFPGFLSKGTTIEAYNYSAGGEWDQDAREQNMEYLLDSFVSRVNQHGQESSGLKEAVEVYKSRGKQTKSSIKADTHNLACST